MHKLLLSGIKASPQPKFGRGVEVKIGSEEA